MRKKLPLLISVVIMASFLSVAYTVRKTGATLAVSKPSTELTKLRKSAYGLVQKQQYGEAIRLYQAARRLALLEGNRELAIQFINNIAGCYHLSYEYREAIQFYRLAHEESRSIGSKAQESLAALNIASLYTETGENQLASGMLSSQSLGDAHFLPSTRLDSLLQLGNIYTRLGKHDEAKAVFQRALAEADTEPATGVSDPYAARLKQWPAAAYELRRAWVFAVISESLNWRGKFKDAEPYILEAFRLRSTYKEPSSLRNTLQLAMVLRDKGDFDAAIRLLDMSTQSNALPATPKHLYLLNREKTRIYLAKGDFNKALPHLRAILRQARQWRLGVLPTNSSFLNFETFLTTESQQSFLDTICNYPIRLDEDGLAVESFWAAEEARFASMRAAQFPAADFISRFPATYWKQLARYQALQVKAMTTGVSSIEEIRSIEKTLASMELDAGLEVPKTPATDDIRGFSTWKAQLPVDEVVFSYYLSEPYSLAWTVDSEGVHLRRIAGRKQLSQWIVQFRSELENSSQIENSSAGIELSRQLFGDYLSTHRTIPYWTMVVDQELSTLPISALPSGRPGARYLLEDHIIRFLPSAIFLHAQADPDWKRKAVAIGDPVYNQADRRVSLNQTTSLDLLQLNRLPASTKEIQQSLSVLSASNWSITERTGLAASAGALRDALTSSPDILHLSTHFVKQGGSNPMLNIALSPMSGFGGGLFSSLDLNSVRTKTKLVVLSGCNSSTGQIVPTIGVNGLSRAFLISGASTVVATLWPTVDTDGPIFPVFYRHLIHQRWSPRAAAQSLRAAQLQMIRQGGWTSKASYWAAYLAISKG